MQPIYVFEIFLSIFSELNIISAQENLPKSVLNSIDAGDDASKMKVLSPRDLIELYIGEDNREADHLDFKKALDLLDYISPAGTSAEEFEEEKVRRELLPPPLFDHY